MASFTNTIQSIIENGDLDDFTCICPIEIDCPITEQGSTCLMIASYYGHLDFVSYLIEQKRANINAINLNGATASIFACKNEQEHVIRYLATQGADLSLCILTGDNVLTITAALGNLPITKLLVEILPITELEHSNQDGMTALLCACEANHVEVADYLLQQGANINATNTSGCTPLILACSKGYLSLIHVLLIDFDANTKIISEAICAQEISDLNEKFRLREAIVHTLKSKAWLPLLDLKRVCEQGHLDALQDLTTRWPEMSLESDVTDNGASALMISALHGHVDICRFLVEEKGCDIERRSADGRTALTYAAYGGRGDVITFLLCVGADASSTNDKGESALIFAIMNGHVNIVKALLRSDSRLHSIVLRYDQICMNNVLNRDDVDKVKDDMISILSEYGFDLQH
eukprot:gene11575-24215_t